MERTLPTSPEIRTPAPPERVVRAAKAPRPDGADGVVQEAMARALLAANRVLITGHADPDGDVAGGCSALHCALKAMGKQSVLFNPDPYPPGYRHLPGCEDLVHSIPEDASFDVTVILDAAHAGKVDAFLPRPATRRGTVLWVDHHPLNGPSGDLEWVDEDASAMGEMLLDLFERMGAKVTPDVGMGMYASLLGDTGGFRYESTTPKALQLAAWLVEQGVQPWRVAEQVYERQPVARVQLLARVLGSLQVSPSGVFASVTITQQDLSESGATTAMSDGMINHARGIDGVEMAGQFEELGDDKWRLTLRSRGGMLASDVATLLGERGHRFGACFVMHGPLGRLQDQVRSAVEQVARTQGFLKD